MRPYSLLVTVLAIAACGGCGGSKQGAEPGAGAAAAAARPAVPVSIAEAVRETVPAEVSAVGNVEAFATVQIKSQIAGQLLAVRFVEGGQINRGDLLFEIDPRPYREALRQAEAAVARDLAQLRQAEANLGRDRAQAKNAQAEAERYDELFKQGIAARNQYEQVRTTYDAMRESARASEAAIESARAAIESDKAAVERARLDLNYCAIHSPVAGRTGNLLVHPGNLVKANGDDALVVINQIEPIFVTFAVPERHLGEIRARTAGGGKLAVVAAPTQDAGKSVRGTLAVIDNTVDAATGTIRLKARFDNHERVLWPGQFVNVSLRLQSSQQTTVPSEAVQAGQQGQFLYVVKQNKTVEIRPVAVGQTTGGKVIIEKGVEPGETVVTDGQLLLYPGASIQAVPASKVESQKL
ncbi:MAG TPA: efflux RND transporter periplasmic adaptor subunit [Bryobacteraceae bacterium]|nr:efflux RND transporter periplasmic adaptor subunit [Bryobacteraceae bacterium]